MQKYKSNAQHVFSVFNIIFLTITCLTCLLPFVNLLAISFSDGAAVRAGKVLFFPVEFTTRAYDYALKGGRFLPAVWISIQRVLLGTAVNLVLIVLTAYPLSKSKKQLAGRNIYMFYFVLIMIFNGGVVPTYLQVTRLGLLNSLWALVLPTALPVFSMIIMMNFIRELPEELEEAAMIDGANSFVVLIRILLPLLKPSLATVGLFAIVNHWNDWFSGLIYMQNYARYPVQTYMQLLIQSFQAIVKGSGGDYAAIIARMDVRSGRAAQLFLGALPLFMIYPFLQKYFTTGLVMGSVKG